MQCVQAGVRAARRAYRTRKSNAKGEGGEVGAASTRAQARQEERRSVLNAGKTMARVVRNPKRKRVKELKTECGGRAVRARPREPVRAESRTGRRVRVIWRSNMGQAAAARAEAGSGKGMRIR